MNSWLVSGWLPEAAWGDWRIWRSGENTVLTEGEFWWMSDMELDIKQERLLRPAGRLLLTGLGLGVAAAAWAALPAVSEVVVLERSVELIARVGGPLKAVRPNVKIVEADAWQPPLLGGRFDFAYHDFLRQPASPEQRAAISAIYGGFCRSQSFWEGWV